MKESSVLGNMRRRGGQIGQCPELADPGQLTNT